MQIAFVKQQAEKRLQQYQAGNAAKKARLATADELANPEQASEGASKATARKSSR